MSAVAEQVSNTVQIDKYVGAFLALKRKNLIGGKWLDAVSGKTFEVFNPATGDVLAHAAESDKADIDLAVKAARKAFESNEWSRMTPSARSKIIWKIGDLILAHLEELAQLEALDNGKPISVARGADVPLAADLFHYMAGWATKIEGNTIPISFGAITHGTDYHVYTRREPVGVVGQIIPWNFPLLMAAWKLGPVLATGCTVVLKPAEETPLSALRLGELMMEAGVPPGVVNIVTGYGETAGAALSGHPDVDKIAFTGSTEVGKLILKASAGNLKKVSLELGGKSPNIILDDANLDVAIPGAANAIFFNQGQTCCAGSRLFVQDKVYDQVIEGISALARQMKVGPGMDPSTQMGPLVSTAQLERVTGCLKSGAEQGARATVGGKRIEGKGYFVEPTVLVDTKPDMKVYREEIFGPVLTAVPFKDVDADLIARANDTIYGLAAGVFTSNVGTAHRIAAQLRAGTVWINCFNAFDAAMPFGGYKQSGWGREMGHEVLNNYTEHKSVCLAYPSE